MNPLGWKFFYILRVSVWIRSVGLRDSQNSLNHKQESIEAVVQRCSVKKVFLKISQNSQENTCTRVSFLIKLQTSGLSKKSRPFRSSLSKKSRRCPVSFAKILRTPFLKNTSRRLLLRFGRKTTWFKTGASGFKSKHEMIR